MNKPATKGDVIFWSLLILFSISSGNSRIVSGILLVIVWIDNTWFAKD